MPYFPVDDSFHSHPKAMASPLSAIGLWAVAGSWSNRHHTDGFVPDYAVLQLSRGETALADELVAAGLWRRVKGGYRFHEWEADGSGTRRNFTSQEVNERRRIKAEAGRKGGLSSGKARSKHEAAASAEPKQDGKQNGTKSNPHTHTHTHKEDSLRSSSSSALRADDDFDRFYAAYPRKEAKKNARKAWDKARKEASAEELIAGAERYATWRSGQDPKFTKQPATWLNQGCWSDDPPPLRAVSGEYQPYRNPTDPSAYEEGL